MAVPNITQGQIAIDPIGGVFYYKDRNNNLINSSLHLLQESVSLIETNDSLSIDGNVIIGGNLTVDGTTVTINTQTLVVEDNIIVLNVNQIGNPTLDAGIEVERGSQPNVQLRWNETIDKWQFSNDGTVYYNIPAAETTNLNDLLDVVLTNTASGEFLQFDGTNWVNSTFASFEPIGHEDKTQSVISFNEGSRQFSISPLSGSYKVWCKGRRYTKTSTETVTIPDTSGLYYIYFNSSGTLAYKTTYFDWENDTPTAYIYWNDADNKAYFFADERHGVTLDWATHEYLHRTRGAAIASGFGYNGAIFNGNGSSNTHAVISIADGTFFDEDLQVDITHSASPTANTWQQRLQNNAYIPIFYHLNSHWVKDTATQFPLKQGASLARYNLNTAGVWSTVDLGNTKFGITWIIATNNLNEPIIGILGQEEYNTLGKAQEAVWENLNLDSFPIFEFRPLYKLIYQTSTSYTNTPKTAFADILDLRRIQSSDQGIPTTPVSDHGSMTGLADDDHTQYLNTDRHSLVNHTLLSVMSTSSTAPTSASEGQIWFNKENGKSFVYYDSFWIEI